MRGSGFEDWNYFLGEVEVPFRAGVGWSRSDGRLLFFFPFSNASSYRTYVREFENR